MKILAIETSCDDTGIAILSAETRETSRGNPRNFKVLANIVASQIEVHKQYGGVFPAMAKREHQRNLLPTLEKALKEADMLNPKSEALNPKQIQNSKFKILNSILEREPELLKQIIPFLQKYQKPDVDFIAVTNGPGLEPCLWVGVNFARALSYFWDIPIVPVNHIEGHILVNFLNLNVGNNYAYAQKLPTFPAVALVVSGGHTQLILVKSKPHFAKASRGTYKILGETRDDAAGECFDKCAKILGLGYPGGPEIAKLASQLQTTNYSLPTKLPRPMINTKDYDFSFSGLKTAVLYGWEKDKEKNKIQWSAEIQQAIIDVLLKKTLKAAKDYGTKTIILGGGVSANSELRKQFQQALAERLNPAEPFNLLFPPANLSTDNALMIAVTGYFNRAKKIAWQKLFANANLRIGDF